MAVLFFKLPIIIFYPLVFLWSIAFGGIAGCIFKIFAVYENWLTINRLQIRLWKRYPQRSYRRYIEGMWQQQINGKPIELVEYSKLQLEKSYPEEPFPFSRLLVNTVFMILISPFMALSGLFYGPIHVFKKLLQQYHHSIGSVVTE